MTRWDQVRGWRDRLRAASLDQVGSSLSAEGLREGLSAALDALSNQALEEVAALEGGAYPTAAVVMAGTVPTACIEWAALLLGRGSEVIIKHPSGDPGLTPLLCALAGALPLSATDDRSVLDEVDVIIAMGSDASVDAIRSAAPEGTPVFGHGHAWSCAWVTGRAMHHDDLVPNGSQDTWDALAADASLYDGRGCLSPALIYTPLPADQVGDAVIQAMTRAASRWPLGVISPAEHAQIRSRRALTKVLGQVYETATHSVHVLPPDRAQPASLPRSLAVVCMPDLEAAVRHAARWSSSLSIVGTDDPSSEAAWLQAGASRICRLGRMQRPPLIRMHDRVEWVLETINPRSPSHPLPPRC